MADSVFLLVAQSCSIGGMTWLALAKKDHWRQLSDRVLSDGERRRLRVLGAAALGMALALCVRADHASMAVLVWVMGLSGSALVVAFTLAWRPRWLLVFAPWVREMARASALEDRSRNT